MSKALIEKLKKSRQTQIQAAGFDFTVRRFNDFDLAEILQDGKNINPKTVLEACVVDWPGMTELRLGIPGGTSESVPFDMPLFIEWVAEQPDVYRTLRDEIWKAYSERKGLVEAELGEPNAGSNLQDSQPTETV
jgi:hypothetical protein